MLERCPYYEECVVETRQMRGNVQYYCLGSLNWEFCSQFQHLSFSGNSFQGYSRDDDIKQIARTITKELKSKLQSPLIMALVTTRGEILYRDRQWSETELLAVQNLVRYRIESINFGEFFKLQNGKKILFLKIHQLIMLVCSAFVELDELIEITNKNLSDYHTNLDTYLNKHPISVEKESPARLEENVILTMFETLQKRLEAINPKIIITDLNQIKEKISELFSWNSIFYEVSVLIERLERYPVQTELKKQEKEEISKKIMEWQENIRKVI
ncbi:MAG: hypothetical protein HWN66_02715 [Candidatus Helarchaeota archaeon]|nr:hypothetical protein [Candidatus Helarchaeota archaeon]